MTMTSSHSEFKHRLTPDGTFESFCLCCFLTIAKGSSEGALIALEIAHQCSGIFSFPSVVLTTGRSLTLIKVRALDPVAR